MGDTILACVSVYRGDFTELSHIRYEGMRVKNFKNNDVYMLRGFISDVNQRRDEHPPYYTISRELHYDRTKPGGICIYVLDDNVTVTGGVRFPLVERL